MNPNQLALGAVLPFLIGGFLYLRGRARLRSGWFFIGWPAGMAFGALWAVIPDLPRLIGAHALYLRLSRMPACDIFFGHYTIDRIEFDSPVFVAVWFVLIYAVIAAALDALVTAERAGGRPRPEAGDSGQSHAPAALHFSAGWLAVSLLLAPGLWRAWVQRRPLGLALTRWVTVSAISGIWAVLPSLSARLGLALPEGAWNLFWGYGWIAPAVRHVQVAGPLLLSALLALQYGAIVAAYFRAVVRRA